MVKKDLSGLAESHRSGGVPPTGYPIFVKAVAESWYQQYQDKGEHMRATAVAGLPYRASFTAFRCDRQLAYGMANTPRPIPNIADAYRMSLGTLVHAGLEDAMTNAFPSAKFEVQVDLRNIGVEGSAHADIVTYHDDGSVDAVVEFKTVNGFGFKSMATDFKGPAQGPRSGHVLQAALSALSLNADRVVVAYLAMENLSPSMKSYVPGDLGRFAAEWHYTRDEYEALAYREIDRIIHVSKLMGIEDFTVPTAIHDDSIPYGAFISDPSRGQWIRLNALEPTIIEDTGKVWFCDYCDWQEQCVQDNAVPVTIKDPF